jgi:hypothetical protein
VSGGHQENWSSHPIAATYRQLTAWMDVYFKYFPNSACVTDTRAKWRGSKVHPGDAALGAATQTLRD